MSRMIFLWMDFIDHDQSLHLRMIAIYSLTARSYGEKGAYAGRLRKPAGYKPILESGISE